MAGSAVPNNKKLFAANRSRVSICGRPWRIFFFTATLIIMQNSVVVSRKCALGCPKNFGDAGPRPLGLGRCDPLEKRCYSTCVILPNFVTLVQTVWAQVELSKKMGRWGRVWLLRNMLLHRLSCENGAIYERNWRRYGRKIDSSSPTFQGYSRSLEPTRIDRLPMTFY